jgi:hypothetical protein
MVAQSASRTRLKAFSCCVDLGEQFTNFSLFILVASELHCERSVIARAQFQRRLTTKLSDGALTLQHAGAPLLRRAGGRIARGRALYSNRRSLQRLVRRTMHHRYETRATLRQTLWHLEGGMRLLLPLSCERGRNS